MSDGIARPAGSGTTIELGGKTLILEPLTLKDYGLVENEYLKRKPNPIEVVAKAAEHLSQEMYDRLLDRAYKDATKVNKATPEEVADWIDSREGIIFTVWIMLRKSYPEMSMEDVEATVGSMAEDELRKLSEARDVSAGIDELGNSTGPSSGLAREKPLPSTGPDAQATKQSA